MLIEEDSFDDDAENEYYPMAIEDTIELFYSPLDDVAFGLERVTNEKSLFN